MPSTCFEEGQAAAPCTQRDAARTTARVHKALDHSRCHTRATHHAALRSRVTIRRPASRAARTSSSTTWPARIASSRRARVRAPRPQTRTAIVRHRRDRTKKTRRRLRALLLRLAQVHRQVRHAAHHAEAQVVSINISYDIAHVLFEDFFALPNTSGGRSSRRLERRFTGDEGGGAAIPLVKATPAAPGFSTLTHRNK